MTLLELAAKVEAAEGPDRRLDQTRDQARILWTQSGLIYTDLSVENLRMLRGMINRAMQKSGLMQGSFRAHQRFTLHLDASQPWAALRCRSNYFTDRQAITFEPTGFIGFAGWADQWTIQPILEAFCKWVPLTAAAIRARSENPA